MKGVYLIDGVRTPIGKWGGTLSQVRADDLAAIPIAKLFTRHADLKAENVEDVVFGCANQAGEDNRNVARMALLLAGMPLSVAGQTVNRLCGSGLSALASAAHAISAGEGELFIAGGVEQMTRAPFVMGKAEQAFSRTAEVYDTSLGWRFINPRMKERYGIDSMGETAENVAGAYKVNREDQDVFALRSQQKATAALRSGRLAKEIVPVEIPQRTGSAIIFKDDEFIRADTTIEKLAALKPAFRHDGKGTVTAGNSSGINDGACALLVASADSTSRFHLRPRAQIIASAVVGVEPRIMGMGPVSAAQSVLRRAGLSLKDMGVVELNEAFAAQSLACIRELGLDDDDSRINPNGGAIALGHPLGMSGARLVLTAMHELEERGERYALCTMCIGVGQGIAMIIERL